MLFHKGCFHSVRCLQDGFLRRHFWRFQVLILQIESEELQMKWLPDPFSKIFNYHVQNGLEVPYLSMMVCTPYLHPCLSSTYTVAPSF